MTFFIDIPGLGFLVLCYEKLNLKGFLKIRVKIGLNLVVGTRSMWTTYSKSERKMSRILLRDHRLNMQSMTVSRVTKVKRQHPIVDNTRQLKGSEFNFYMANFNWVFHLVLICTIRKPSYQHNVQAPSV